MRNSSLVEWCCAENPTGLKPSTEAADLAHGVAQRGVVGERSALGRRQTVKTAGRGGSANAGMSSEKAGENPARRKAKDSYGRFVRVRLGGT